VTSKSVSKFRTRPRPSLTSLGPIPALSSSPGSSDDLAAFRVPDTPGHRWPYWVPPNFLIIAAGPPAAQPTLGSLALTDQST
jgi:hypothetical protein